MKRIGQNRLEWALLGLIAVLCAGLSFLQYRWTGEVSRAEQARLRSALDGQVASFVRAFDEELRESCRTLLPDEAEIKAEGAQEAHRARFEQWSASHDRSLLTRIGIAIPEPRQGTLNLFSLDHSGQMAPMAWPPIWEPLRTSMTARMNGAGPPPLAPQDSTLVESPVFGHEVHGRQRPEIEWMIFEVNEEYLRDRFLPHLLAEHLSFGGDADYDVSVSWADPRRPVFFSTRADKSSVEPGADLTAGIFSANVAAAADRRHRRPERRPDDDGPGSRWVMSVRHREGSLEAAVAHARVRNMLTSLVLISLLGGAAWALVRYTARSRRLSEMQFRFAAGVSHDLRTPLTAIRGAAFNLANGVVTEPAAIGRYAHLILRNAEELTAMIENVLAFSATMHSNTAPERSETFAVGDLVEHAAASLYQEIEQAGCRLELNVAPDLPAVTGDSVALEHAFRNLIGNAARHAAQGKWIGVSAERRDSTVEVQVSDRGPGIPEVERERIFEPFYRSEQTRSTQVRGTGLGLSLVKDTVERHGGTLTVHNSPSGGTQFIVRLPALAEVE